MGVKKISYEIIKNQSFKSKIKNLQKELKMDKNL